MKGFTYNVFLFLIMSDHRETPKEAKYHCRLYLWAEPRRCHRVLQLRRRGKRKEEADTPEFPIRCDTLNFLLSRTGTHGCLILLTKIFSCFSLFIGKKDGGSKSTGIEPSNFHAKQPKSNTRSMDSYLSGGKGKRSSQYGESGSISPKQPPRRSTRHKKKTGRNEIITIDSSDDEIDSSDDDEVSGLLWKLSYHACQSAICQLTYELKSHPSHFISDSADETGEEELLGRNLEY